jgi:hypothetical protein
VRREAEVPRIRSVNPHGFYSYTVYLMSRSVAQNYIRIVSSGLEWFRKEVVLASYEIVPEFV